MNWLRILISLALIIGPAFSVNYSLIIPVYADYIYIDDDGICAGYNPCYANFSDALASPFLYENTTFYVFNGTYSETTLIFNNGRVLTGEKGAYVSSPIVLFNKSFDIYNVTFLSSSFALNGLNNSILNFTLNLTGNPYSFYLENSSNVLVDLNGSIAGSYYIYYRNLSNVYIDYEYVLTYIYAWSSRVVLDELLNTTFSGFYDAARSIDVELGAQLGEVRFENLEIDGWTERMVITTPSDSTPIFYNNLFSQNFTSNGDPVCVFVDNQGLEKECGMLYARNVSHSRFNITGIQEVYHRAGLDNRLGSVYSGNNISIHLNKSLFETFYINAQDLYVVSEQPTPELYVYSSSRGRVEGNFSRITDAAGSQSILYRVSATEVSLDNVYNHTVYAVAEKLSLSYASSTLINNSTAKTALISGGDTEILASDFVNLSLINGKVFLKDVNAYHTYYRELGARDLILRNLTTLDLYLDNLYNSNITINHSSVDVLYIKSYERANPHIIIENTLLNQIVKRPTLPLDVITTTNTSSAPNCSSLEFNTSENLTCVLYIGSAPVRFSQGYTHNLTYSGYGDYEVVCWSYSRALNDDFESGNFNNWYYTTSWSARLSVVNQSLAGVYSALLNITSAYASYDLIQKVPENSTHALVLYKAGQAPSLLRLKSGDFVGEYLPSVNWTLAQAVLLGENLSIELVRTGEYYIDQVIYLNNPVYTCKGTLENLSLRNVVATHNIFATATVLGPFYIENPLFNFTDLIYYDGFEEGPYLERSRPGKGFAQASYSTIPGPVGKAASLWDDITLYGTDILANSSKGFTISFWWNGYVNSYGNIITSPSIIWSFLSTPQNSQFRVTSGYNTYTMYLPYYPGEWRMYTFVWDPAGPNISVYVDGTFVNSTPASSVIDPPDYLIFNTKVIDELFVFGRPLSPQEISDLYHYAYFPKDIDVTLDGTPVEYGWDGIDRIWINASLSPGAHTIELASPGSTTPSLNLSIERNPYYNLTEVYYGIYNKSLSMGLGDQILFRTYWDGSLAYNFLWAQIINQSVSLVNLTLNRTSSYPYLYYFGGSYHESTSSSSNTTPTIPNITNGDFEDGTLSGWTTGGDQPWVVQSFDVYEGVYAAQAGPITDGQTSWLEVTVTLSSPADLVFAWKVSSEAWWDFGEVYVDGTNVLSESGVWTAWQVERIPLSAGTHIIRFVYTKDPDCCSDGDDTVYLDWVHLEPPSGGGGSSPSNEFAWINTSYKGLSEFRYNLNSTHTWLEAKRGTITELFSLNQTYIPTEFWGNFTDLYLTFFQVAKGQNFVKVQNVSYELASGCKALSPIVNNSLITEGNITFTFTNYETTPGYCEVYVNNALACNLTGLSTGTYSCDPGLGEGQVITFNVTCAVGNNTCAVPETTYQYFRWVDNQSHSRVIYDVNLSSGYNYLVLPANFTSAGDGYYVTVINSSDVQEEVPFRVLSVNTQEIALIVESPETLSTYLLLYLRNETPYYNVGITYNASQLGSSLSNGYLWLYPGSTVNLTLGNNFVIVGTLNLLTPPEDWYAPYPIDNYTSNAIDFGGFRIQVLPYYSSGRVFLINSTNAQASISLSGSSYSVRDMEVSAPWAFIKTNNHIISYIGHTDTYAPKEVRLGENISATTLTITPFYNPILLVPAIREIILLPSIAEGSASLYKEQLNDIFIITYPNQHEESPNAIIYYSSRDRTCDMFNVSAGNGYYGYSFGVGWYNWTLSCENYTKVASIMVDQVSVTYLGPYTVNETHKSLRFNVTTSVNDWVGCLFVSEPSDYVNLTVSMPGLVEIGLNFSIGENNVSYRCWTWGSDTILGKITLTTDFPPEVSIISPANNSTITSSIFNIQVNVSDENISQVSCDIYLNNTYLFSFNNTSSFNQPYYLTQAGYYYLNVTCNDGQSTTEVLSYFIKTGTGDCFSCEECNTMLQDPIYSGVIARVDLNVPAYMDACIYLNVSKSFSCDNTYIYGNENQSGVLITADGQVSGCGFYGLGAGINVTSGASQILQVNSSNNIYGLYIEGGSPNVQLSRFTFNVLDIYNVSSSSANNNICNTYYQWSENGHPGCSYTYPENTIPEITIHYPELYVNSTTFPVMFEVYDNYSQTFNCNVTSNVINIVNRSEVTNATVSIPNVEGAHELWIECWDVAGNLNRTNFTIIYDSTPPNITLLSPINGSTYVGNSVLFNFTVWDISNVSCKILNNSYNLSSSGTVEDYLIFAPGYYTVNVSCWDEASNLQVINVSFQVSTSYINVTPNPANVSIEAGQSGVVNFTIAPQLVSSLTNVIITVDSCPYSSCTVYPSAFSTLTSPENFTLTVELPLAEGILDDVVYLRATENTNFTTLIIPVYVDARSPYLYIVAPSTTVPLETPTTLGYALLNGGESPYYNVSVNITCSGGIQCNLSDPFPDTLLPGQNISLNITVYVPYNYTNAWGYGQIVWRSHIGTSYYPISFRVGQPNLVTPRYQMLVSNVTTYLNYNVVNLGVSPAVGVIASVSCPAGFLCNITPVSFDVYNATPITFGAKQTTAINDDVAVVTMQDVAGRTWHTYIELKISKPNLTLNYTPDLLSYGTNQVTLSFNNTGDKPNLNATLLISCDTACSLNETVLPQIDPNQTHNLTLELNLSESYNNPTLEVNLTALEDNGRTWRYTLLFEVPQPNLTWAFNTTTLPKNTSTLTVIVQNIGTYPLTNATFGILCPASWVCSNITGVSLVPGQTTTLTFTITVPGHYYYPQATLTFYASNPTKYLSKDVTFDVLQPNLNHTQPYIVLAPGENLSSYVNVTNIGNWTLTSPTLSLDLLPPTWNITITSTLPSLAPNQTAPINFTILVPSDETLSQRFFRILITELYGKVWYADVVVNIKQPDLSISYEPAYLDIGGFNVSLNITNNGTLELLDMTPSLVCPGTTAYLTNATLVSLYPNQSITFGAFINVNSQPQNCVLYLYNENRTLVKNISFNVKRLNLAISHNMSSSVPVGYVGSHAFNLTNLEPYAVNFTAEVLCLDCESEYFNGGLLPNQSVLIRFNMSIPIDYAQSTYRVVLSTYYKGAIQYLYNYTLTVIQPSISISTVSPIRFVHAYSGVFTVINLGIPTNATIMLECPSGLLCQANETTLSLSSGETRDIFYNVSIVGPVNQYETMIIKVLTPSKNFTHYVSIEIDRGIDVRLEEKTLYPATSQELLLNITNLRPSPTEAQCSVDCPALWSCALNETSFNLTTQHNLSLSIFIPNQEISTSGAIEVTCVAHNISSLFRFNRTIYQPTPELILHSFPLNIGENNLTLEIVPDSNLSQSLSLISSCDVPCYLNATSVYTNQTHNLLLNISLPDSYTLPYVNVTITATDGVRTYTLSEQIPTNISALVINTRTDYFVPRGQYTNIPIQVLNLGLVNATNATMYFQCSLVTCNVSNITFNVTAGGIYTYDLWVYKGYEIEEGYVDVVIKNENQTYTKRFFVRPLLPRLVFIGNTSWTAFQNTTLSIPFAISNLGNDSAISLNVSVTCPIGINCSVSFLQGYNLVVGQSRSGIINITIPEDQVTPIYLTLTATEATLSSSWTINVTPEVMPTFDTITPTFVLKQTYQVNATYLTLLDINGTNRVVFVNASGIYYIDQLGVHLLLNETVDGLDSGYFDSDSYLDLVIAQHNNISFLYSSLNYSKVYNFSVVFPVIALTALDSDGDGIDDLALSTTNNQLSIYLNNGSKFVKNASVSINAISLTAYDYDGDGKGDIVAGDPVGQINFIRYPYSNITIITPNLHSNPATKLTMGDVYASNYTAVILGDGLGELEYLRMFNNSFVKRSLGYFNTTIKDIVSYDFEGDGDLDLVFTNGENITYWEVQSNIRKYVSVSGTYLTITITIINPFLSTMKNVTVEDFWNPGEVIFPTHRKASIYYVSSTTSSYQEIWQSDLIWTGTRVILPSYIDMEPFSVLRITYYLERNASSPVYYGPKVSYQRVPPRTDPLPVLVSDHIKHTSPYHVVNPLYGSLVNVVDGGSVTGNLPDYVPLGLEIKDSSYRKYVTTLEDPNACLVSCPLPATICIPDPSGRYVGSTRLMAYNNVEPILPYSIVNDQPVYGSLVFARATISNIGEVAAQGPVAFYLNNLQYLTIIYNLSVNQTQTLPSQDRPEFLAYGYPTNLGENELKVVIDPNNLMGELNKSNNILVKKFNITQYADYVINDVYLADRYGTPLTSVSGGFQAYIAVNVSNLGNRDGYVLLNASLNNSEFYNGAPVGTEACLYGRRPYLAFVPANNSTLVLMGPISFQEYGSTVNLTLKVSIYPHITGYPEDINLSNNNILSYEFQVVPSPPELDFYNSSKVGSPSNYTLSPNYPQNDLRIDWVEPGRIENISLYAWNLGGAPATVNLSVYLDVPGMYVINYSRGYVYDMFNNSVWDHIQNLTPVYTQSVTLPPGRTRLNITQSFNFSHDSYHSIVLVLDPVGSEDNLSNIYVVHYIPPDVKLKAWFEEHPLPGSVVRVDYLINCTYFDSPIGPRVVFGSYRPDGDRIRKDISPGYYWNVSPGVGLEAYLNHSLVFNITYPDNTLCLPDKEHVLGTFTFTVPDPYQNISFDMIADPAISTGDIRYDNNILNEMLVAPYFANFTINVTNDQLFAGTMNRITVDIQEANGSCANIDHIALYLKVNNSWYLLHARGEFAREFGDISWFRVCNRTTYQVDVYIPNVSSSNAQLYVQILSGYKSITPTPLYGLINITLPGYDRLWYEASSLPLKINNIPVLIREGYPHVGTLPSGTYLEVNQQITLYLYREFIYNKSVVMVHGAPVEVRIT